MRTDKIDQTQESAPIIIIRGYYSENAIVKQCGFWNRFFHFQINSLMTF